MNRFIKLNTFFLRDRESGDYASSDVQSVSSRLSALSVETSRSEHQETSQMMSAQYYAQLEGKIRHFKKSFGYTGSEDGLSPCQSSDYEDQDEFNNCMQQIATVHVVKMISYIFFFLRNLSCLLNLKLTILYVISILCSLFP